MAGSMQQLPLRVAPADDAVFENFLPGDNASLVHALADIARVASRALLWLWGPAESGRTHLLQATVNTAAAAGFRAAYLPLADGSLQPSALEGLGEFDLLCLDDIDAVAGQAAWETAVFRVFESLRARRARLVVSAAAAPLHTSFGLPDLSSRLSSGATFRVRLLSDEDKQAALQRRAAWRGLELPDETAEYLLTRAERGMAALFDLLERLDRESLAAQKRLTVPFVRQVLASADDAGP